MQIWSLRLSVRTRGFHPRKRGSIPLGTAKIMYFVYLIVSKNKKPKPRQDIKQRKLENINKINMLVYGGP